MKCTKCGTAVSGDMSVCENCGNSLETTRSAVFVYDYKTVETDSRSSAELVDYYEALGWELANRNESGLMGRTSLTFKRNRKIKNKDQLNRIQVRLDDAVEGIKVFEKNKTNSAVVVALIIGIVGALMFGGGMCLCMFLPLVSALVSYIVGCIVGVVGLGVCGLAYLAYLKIRAKNTSRMDVSIDKKKDDIAGLCEEAQRLLV